jgi:BirA family transcriptional regulator, biotin operon repressor / biotin---[acetyl-CoA-carboxylase] ligase
MEYPIRFLEKYLDYHLFSCKEIDSTNDYFKREGKHFPSPSVLMADYQTKGRGRYIRKWEGGNKDLLFSIITDKKVRYEVLMPVAIMMATRKYHLPTFIKWPNDIYIEDRKLSGILIEQIYEGKAFGFQIIGVGINFTKKESLQSAGIEEFTDALDKYSLLKEILDTLEEIKKLPFEQVMQTYTNNNLIYNREIHYQEEKYKVIGFTPEGHLLAENDYGRRIIQSDEIDIKKSMEAR